MLDKLEAEYEPETRWCGVVADLVGAVRSGVQVPGSSGAVHYSRMLKLKEYGFPAVIHYGLKRGSHSHKLGLLDCGQRTLADSLALMEKITAVDPLTRRLIRL